MRIDVRSNIKDATKWLTNIEKKQVPFATMLALNWTKDRCQDGVKTEMLRKLHKPTPFTMNLFFNGAVTRATKTRSVATVEVKNVQADYLYSLFYGGTETDNHIVPGQQAKLNQYGNLPRRASKAKGTFTIKSNGLPITLKRTGRGKNKGNWNRKSRKRPRSRSPSKDSSKDSSKKTKN